MISTTTQVIDQNASFGRIACPNPDCINGYSSNNRHGLSPKICTSCDGFGYLRSVSENRKRYYALRNLASELELQSRLGRGLLPQASKLIDAEPVAAESTRGSNESGANINEHMIVKSGRLSECFRVS